MLDKKIQDELIRKGRAFTRGYREDDPYQHRLRGPRGHCPGLRQRCRTDFYQFVKDEDL